MSLENSNNISKESISTGRTLEQYMSRIFPECKSKEDLSNFLDGKTIVDIGSGLTHKNPFSLINIAAGEKEKQINFFGVEPRLLGKGDLKFSIKDKLLEKGNVLVERLSREKLLTQYKKPGEKKLVAALADQLPFTDNSVDILTSVGLVGYWITSKEELKSILEEFSRVLKEEGEIRISAVKPEVLEFFEHDDFKMYKYEDGFVKLVKKPLQNKDKNLD